MVRVRGRRTCCTAVCDGGGGVRGGAALSQGRVCQRETEALQRKDVELQKANAWAKEVGQESTELRTQIRHMQTKLTEQQNLVRETHEEANELCSKLELLPAANLAPPITGPTFGDCFNCSWSGLSKWLCPWHMCTVTGDKHGYAVEAAAIHRSTSQPGQVQGGRGPSTPAQ